MAEEDDSLAWIPVLFDEVDDDVNDISITNDISIVCKCNTDTATAMQSGSSLWPAARSLSRWLLNGMHLEHENCVIIELGCGVGLLGIFCVKYLHAAAAVLTDYSPSIVDVAIENAHLNGMSIMMQEKYKFHRL